MSWLLLYEILYAIILVVVCLRIVYDTRSTVKTIAYLMLAIFVPFVGIFFYFSFGINYRKRKIYSKKLFKDEALARQVEQSLLKYSRETLQQAPAPVQQYKGMAYLLAKGTSSALTADNDLQLLVNGEQKFPELLKAIEAAKHHIHMEYYIYEDDEVGRQIADILIQKAAEGVVVRFVYDDFGSRSIRKKLVGRLRAGGVQTFPFFKVHFWRLANRLNYRNHRKLVVIDGQVGFVGGINISDRYWNKPTGAKQIFWRDTHLRIEGPGVTYLQYLFFCDWNFCAAEHLQPDLSYFPGHKAKVTGKGKIVQIAASGPDSETPTILFTLLQAIHRAKKEILITTPYFIPGDSLMDALVVAAMGGVVIKLLVPGISDSKLVNAAAYSYYEELLAAGVHIYLYQKGFVHAKTMVCDQELAIVGTANMDYRSFDLNFEVNALVYDEELATKLAQEFDRDLVHARQIHLAEWRQRPMFKQVLEKIARLTSPLL